MVEVGIAEGTCPNCGRTLCAPRSISEAMCDCWRYCPTDHGNGEYGTLMDDYMPDMEPQTYGELTGDDLEGDLEHPMHVLKICPICKYHSTQGPVLVKLS
jgi:hypothetical protein